jgi:catechol 2,3-dioxygenase-like lactoylglutathione lyase family enzyme
MPDTPLRIDHLALPVYDAAKTLHFYSEVLQLGLPSDVRHYALSVASPAQQEQWKARLREHGVLCSEEDHGTQHSIYFSDPNGIVLEVTTPASSPDLQPAAHAAQRVQRWIAAQSGSGAAE